MVELMANPSKAKGTKFETDVVRFFRERLPGRIVERLPQLGNLDQGDLVVVDPPALRHFVVEAKAVKRLDFAGFLTEAQAEADNYAAARTLTEDEVFPVVVAKRRYQPTARSYVVMDLDTFARLID